MKLGLIIIGVVIVIGIIFFVPKSLGDKKPLIQVARQIKLDQLETVMEQRKSKSLELRLDNSQFLFNSNIS